MRETVFTKIIYYHLNYLIINYVVIFQGKCSMKTFFLFILKHSYKHNLNIIYNYRTMCTELLHC